MLGSNEAWKGCRWRNGSETLLSKIRLRCIIRNLYPELYEPVKLRFTVHVIFTFH